MTGGHQAGRCGARRARAYDSTMTPRRLLPIVALVGMLAVAGCAANPAAAAPEPKPTDCAQLLTHDELVILVGSGAAPITPDPSPVVTDGSASICSWRGAERSLTVSALPVTAVPAKVTDRYAMPECVPGSGFCGGSVTDEDLWIVVDFGWIDGEWEPYVSTALNAVQRSDATG